MNHPEDAGPQISCVHADAQQGEGEKSSLQQAVASGTLLALVEEYVSACHPTANDADLSLPKTRSRKEACAGDRFPNLAGLCRFLGCSLEEWLGMEGAYPILFGRIRAVLEDEALNVLLSATLIGAYLKRRLGYDREGETAHTEQTTICFEHDIWEDGE